MGGLSYMALLLYYNFKYIAEKNTQEMLNAFKTSAVQPTWATTVVDCYAS